MTEATPGRRFGGVRIAVILAVVLAVVGAVLITYAVHGSRPGAPQPSAAQAGNINPPAEVSVADSSAVSSGTGTTAAPPVPVGTTAATTPAESATTKAAKPTPATRTPASKPAKPATTAPKTTEPKTTARKTTPIVLPSFANPAKGLILQSSAPVSLSIPALGVTSPLLTLGLNPDGTVEVPSLDDPDSKAGWYKGSPTPGSVGPAIVLGHIDSKKYGPGVFYKIGSLTPGQEVDVTRKDGTVAVFKIDGVRSYPKDQFPTKDVYGNIDHAGLRLITCGGTFDPNKGSYESNIVVYASLKSTHQA
jgi:sortase (surface protein transpeptidase)